MYMIFAIKKKNKNQQRHFGYFIFEPYVSYSFSSPQINTSLEGAQHAASIIRERKTDFGINLHPLNCSGEK